MSNLQLLLTIGIPSLLVILSWINGNSRLARLEASTDKRFDELNHRIDALEVKYDKRFDELGRRVDTLEAKMDRRFDESNRRTDNLDAKFDRRFDALAEAIGSLRERVAVMENAA